jgi:CheY-like chemotaxis protein
VVRLPVVTGAGQDAPAALEKAAEPGPSEKILVVDDNRDAAQTMAYLLQAEGHEVKTAYGGEEAVTQAAEFRPDLIFMDLGMPQVDGYEATRRIRALSDAGMDGHLVKPADPRVLREVISRRQDMHAT